jgi:UDP-N-acetyl-D-galactosamine dehydrogenase
MALYVAGEVVRLMTAKRIHVKSSRVLVMGLAFKENCPDLRNSKVADLVRELVKFGAAVDVWDPWVSAQEARHEYGIRLVKKPVRGRYDAVVVAVGHRQFQAMKPAELRRLAKRNHVLYDIKHVFARQEADGRL